VIVPRVGACCRPDWLAAEAEGGAKKRILLARAQLVKRQDPANDDYSGHDEKGNRSDLVEYASCASLRRPVIDESKPQ
jgi:hypothetical protein